VDDDLDCVQSVPVGYDGSPAVKKSLPVMKTKTLASPKKLSKSFSPNSAPKRTFDSAVWLMVSVFRFNCYDDGIFPLC
jgi:hypothetical protein